MNSLVLAPFSSRGLSFLAKLGKVTYEPWTSTETIWDPVKLASRCNAEHINILIVEIDFLFDELFENAQTLKIAAICRGGLNQVETTAANRTGVTMLHTPGRNAPAVAEFILAQMFNLSRQISTAASYVASHLWQNPIEPYIRFRGRELKGKTLGLIGFGAIGQEVAFLAQGIGMSVIAYDPYVNEYSEEHSTASLVGIDELLTLSDFISVQIPDYPSNSSMLNAERISAMKEGVYIISVVGSSVIEASALLDGLANGQIAGAALDVHETHPISPAWIGFKAPNLVLTPHIGGSTQETIERHSSMICSDITSWLARRTPENLINRKT